MQVLSKILSENKAILEFSQKEDSEFYEFFSKKYQKKLPFPYNTIIELTVKYHIYSKELLEQIKHANRNELIKIAKDNNIDNSDITKLYNALLNIKQQSPKAIPQYLNKEDRQSILKGKILPEDLLLDFETPQGKNEVVKKFIPLIHKIINQLASKTRLSKSDLLSAAMEGFNDAINEFDFSKGLTFKTYAGVRVRQACLDEINKNGHSLSKTNWYSNSQDGSSTRLDAMSLDNFFDGDGDMDRLGALAYYDPTKNMGNSESHNWKELFNLLEKKFSQRDMDIFYKYFGLNNYKREKSKDIAKSYGMSLGNIRNAVINKILKFLQTNPKSNSILKDLQDLYTESLMFDLYSLDKNNIYETLINDDTYILLEELNRWRYNFNEIFEDSLNKTNRDVILNILDNDSILYTEVKNYKSTIIEFLEYMYPNDIILRNNDNLLIERLLEIKNKLKNMYTFSEYFKILENETKINSVDDFKEFAEDKFKDIFKDKLDKKRMEITIDGFLRTNEKLVKDKQWDKLVGMFKNSLHG